MQTFGEMIKGKINTWKVVDEVTEQINKKKGYKERLTKMFKNGEISQQGCIMQNKISIKYFIKKIR